MDEPRAARRCVLPDFESTRGIPWPDSRRIRALLQSAFDIQSVTTIDPGGDQGVLWWVENDVVRGLMSRIVGAYRWRRLLEVAGLGRELIVTARRR